MKYALFGKYDLELKLKIPYIYDEESPDIVFSLGGDGTMLGAIHKYNHILDKVKFVGINTGRLGFFTDFTIEEIDYVIEIINNNKYRINGYNVLEYILKNDDAITCGIAINELAITNPIHTQIIDVYINDRYFETFRGTGLLISPPGGSTAYNKSLGGSVIDPQIKAIQLTEIAPINNRVYRSLDSPLVLSENSNINLKISDNENVYISVDGKFLDFPNLLEATLSTSKREVKFIEKEDTIFFEKVKRSFIEH